MIPIQSGSGLADALFFTPFVILGIAIIGFGTAILYLEYRKEMALIESGQYADVNNDPRAWILGGGLLLLALGLGNVVSSVLSGGTVGEGITAAFVGLAALVYYFYKRQAVAAAGA
ncbi:hypothetical protein C440_10978 [Haloferax mucosum ATCC BAA-1512]|uniref:Uncharacterized protein n=1 Tax=Haloferax mucosum ATCC BAA-1512 TaxID=662479 RepID=M0IFA7_9EURY|nr:hypothetical protein [Haloferax mucosum]ELZ94139.1 hypothetical protein C440_10978 [Haloferax mucosum ATCC BAA-1512]